MKRLTERYVDEDEERESDYIEHVKNFVILLSMINTFFAREEAKKKLRRSWRK